MSDPKHACDTCNAAKNNDFRRIARCGTCFYVPNKMPSKYAPGTKKELAA